MKNNIDIEKNLTITIDDTIDTEEQKYRARIDKKLKKITTLTKQIETITHQIKIAKNLYHVHTFEIEQTLLLQKEALVLKLYERLQQKAFAVWQKEVLTHRIYEEIEFLLNKDYESPRIMEIYEEIKRIDTENMDDFEREMMNEMTKDFFRNIGVDIDEENFDFSDLDTEEFKEKFQQDFSKQHSEYEHQEKQKQQEQKVKTTDKDFQKLYRALVKKAHPDLVINAQEKKQREEWMKKLSQAWEERNYYQLLVLQKMIDTDDSMEVSLHKKQIQPLLDQLNQEIETLEIRKSVLQTEDPETAFYYEYFYAKSEKGILKKIKEFKLHLQLLLEDTEEDMIRLKTQKSTKELLIDIRDSEVDDFDDFDAFFDFIDEM